MFDELDAAFNDYLAHPVDDDSGWDADGDRLGERIRPGHNHNDEPGREPSGQ